MLRGMYNVCIKVQKSIDDNREISTVLKLSPANAASRPTDLPTDLRFTAVSLSSLTSKCGRVTLTIGQ